MKNKTKTKHLGKKHPITFLEFHRSFKNNIFLILLDPTKILSTHVFWYKNKNYYKYAGRDYCKNVCDVRILKDKSDSVCQSDVSTDIDKSKYFLETSNLMYHQSTGLAEAEDSRD